MAKAGRIFFPLDVNWYDDWGCLVSIDAGMLWIVAVCLSKRLISDGVLTINQLRRNAPEELIQSSVRFSNALSQLTETLRCPLDSVDDSHVQVRGWLSWNDGADDITAMMEGGVYGNHVKWHIKRKQKPKSPCVFCDELSGLSGGDSGTISGVDIQETETETETETDVSRTRRKKSTTVPEDFEITERLHDWVKQNGFDSIDLENQTQLFLDHHAAKGSTYTDWNRAWQTWIRNRATWDKGKPNAATIGSHYVPANQMTPEQVEATYAGMPVVGWPE